MIQHKLILIYGAGSGMGKSTLGRALSDALTQSGIENLFFEEHDVVEIPEFVPYVAKVEADEGDDSETLLECCRAFAAAVDRYDSKALVMESLIPGWDWLASAYCSQEKIDRFTIKLSSVLAELNPLLIILNGDIKLALKRAINDRGEAWALNLAQARMGVPEAQALGNYFVHLRKSMNATLPFWPHKVIEVETTKNDVKDSVEVILRNAGA